MPMQEFFERIILKAGARARPSDNEFRDSRLKAITEHIQDDF